MMISFSGIDCSGKSTQINLLVKEYRKRGKKCEVVWSRGGYTPGLDLLKEIIRHGKVESKEQRLEYSKKVNDNSYKRKILFILGLIDMWFYYSIVLRIKEWSGRIIICDRYIWDTYIDYKIKYPDYKFENGFWWKLTLMTMLKPKYSFCLTIPAEESMRRSELKEEPFPEEIELRKKRIALYLNEIRNNRWAYVIDALQPIETVYSEIKKVIKK